MHVLGDNWQRRCWKSYGREMCHGESPMVEKCVCHFLQGTKSTELETVINLIWIQPEKCGMNFDATVSYLGQMVMNKGPSMQSVHIAKTRSQPLRSEVVALTRKVEFKK